MESSPAPALAKRPVPIMDDSTDSDDRNLFQSFLRIICLSYLLVSLAAAAPAVVPGLPNAQFQPTQLSERVAVLEAQGETDAINIRRNEEDIRSIVGAINELRVAHENTMRSVDGILWYAQKGVQILAAIALTVFVEVTRRLFNIVWPWPKRSKK